jgi:hypothetical protein
MPVSMLPERVDEWPAHLEPIWRKFDATPVIHASESWNRAVWGKHLGTVLRRAHRKYERRQTRATLWRSLRMDTRRKEETRRQIEIGREMERCLILMAETYRDAEREQRC